MWKIKLEAALQKSALNVTTRSLQYTRVDLTKKIKIARLMKGAAENEPKKIENTKLAVTKSMTDLVLPCIRVPQMTF